MYGHHVHEAVLRSGAALSGPTIHFVDERYDEGRIFAQWPVPVLPGDTPDALAARVLRVEHALYPRPRMRWPGRCRVDGRVAGRVRRSAGRATGGWRA